jgi:DNA invertase Pin-like site-specific DNA recombinase
MTEGGAVARATAYLRVSTAEQADSGQGLDVQRDRITAWAASTGRVIVAWRIDAGVSGSNGLDDRVGLGDALNDLDNGATELVVANIDRLARDLVLQEVLLRQVRAAGGEVRSVEPTEDANLATGTEDTEPARVLIRQVLGALAEYERKIIRLRLMRGRRKKRDQGLFIGGTVGYGLQLDGDNFVPDPETWPVLERIAKARAAGAYFGAIAKELNTEGVVGPEGGPWYPTTIRRAYLRYVKVTGAE